MALLSLVLSLKDRGQMAVRCTEKRAESLGLPLRLRLHPPATSVVFSRWQFDVTAPSDISGSWFINLLLKCLYFWPMSEFSSLDTESSTMSIDSYPWVTLSSLFTVCAKIVLRSLLILISVHQNMCVCIHICVYIYINDLLFSTFNNHLGSAYCVSCVALGAWHTTQCFKHLSSLYKSFSLHFWGYINEETKVFSSSSGSALGLLVSPILSCEQYFFIPVDHWEVRISLSLYQSWHLNHIYWTHTWIWGWGEREGDFLWEYQKIPLKRQCTFNVWHANSCIFILSNLSTQFEKAVVQMRSESKFLSRLGK